MYKLKREDIRYTKWAEYEGRLIAHAVLYLGDGQAPRTEADHFHFGYRSTAELPLAASAEDRQQALKEAADKLLDRFDIQQSAKNQGFNGDFNKLSPIGMPSTLTWEQVTNV